METKVYSNGPVHMTKMAIALTDGKKNLRKSSPEPVGHWGHGNYQDCLNDYPKLSLTYLSSPFNACIIKHISSETKQAYW